jgi:hypothetical protein|tara:strand:+ start:7651 stop:8349 length:699 start_codon:yes stop_codon:yes gene_type:complete
MKDYIKTSAEKTLNERSEYHLISSGTPLNIIEKFPPHININKILKLIKKNIPNVFFDVIEGIYVGDFKELKKRNIQAMFKDGVVYVSSFKNVPYVSEELIVSDICHELGHGLEDQFGREIYSDGKIESEYEGKKKKLLSLLKYDGYNLNPNMFFSDEKVDEFDNFLFNDLTYDKLSYYIAGLFTSPYSVTSIREYFANGLEDYLLGDREYLKKTSPSLYKKINNLYKSITGE